MWTSPSGGVHIGLTTKNGGPLGYQRGGPTGENPGYRQQQVNSETWSQNLRFLRPVTLCVETIFDGSSTFLLTLVMNQERQWKALAR